MPKIMKVVVLKQLYDLLCLSDRSFIRPSVSNSINVFSSTTKDSLLIPCEDTPYQTAAKLLYNSLCDS